jgi:hypothetical protein
MKRKHIASIATAFAVSLATGAAFAQVANGPDFSPMKPGNYEELPTQSAPAEPGYAPPAYEAPANPPQNRMLEAYESSAAPIDTTGTASTYQQPARPGVAVVPARQATIGNGLFDRRGPNDFGS